MYLFCILLLPCLLAFYLLHKEDKAHIVVALVGFFVGVLLCTIKAFFTSSYRVAHANFFHNYFYFLFFQFFLPIAILYILFFLFSNEGVYFKMDAYFPLLCAFYSVYLPYRILAGSEPKYSLYELFLKPVLYASMCILSATCIKGILLGIVKKMPTTLLWTLLFFVSILIPALIESLYFVGFSSWIYLVPFLIYILIAAFTFTKNKELYSLGNF
ncbi:MAG: hypothetical protein IJR49_04665 [Treponema sp.]|nr:hypothetical protein [Treponema sp.]